MVENYVEAKYIAEHAFICALSDLTDFKRAKEF
jgi:hypothetical protein